MMSVEKELLNEVSFEDILEYMKKSLPFMKKVLS